MRNVRFAPWLLFALALAPAVRAADAPEDSAAQNLLRYGRIVDSLQTSVALVAKDSIVEVTPCKTTPTRYCAEDYRALVFFLKSQKEFAESIRSKLKAGAFQYEDYLSVLPQLRGILDQENNFTPALAAHPASRREADAYVTYVYPLLDKSFLAYAAAANTLLRTKYFSSGDTGNFLEGWFNGKCGFTRTAADPSSAGDNFGVSHWEMLMRVEPVYLLRDKDIQNFGGLFATGLLFHFFPSVTIDPKANGSLKVKPTFRSSVLKDAGFKVGIGAHGDDLRWGFGGALQLNAFSLWYVYSWQEDRSDIALSLSDLGIVRKLLPIFK